jgi:hypothetical protein
MDAIPLPRIPVPAASPDDHVLRDLWASLPVTGPYPALDRRWLRALELTLGALQPERLAAPQ